MSRRCKPGQRARIINSITDKGKVVLVLSYYFGEVIAGASWPKPIFPWVVTSLGAPLGWARLDGSKKGTAMTVVLDDCDLEPLDDDDGRVTTTTKLEQPVVRSKTPPVRKAGKVVLHD